MSRTNHNSEDTSRPNTAKDIIASNISAGVPTWLRKGCQSEQARKARHAIQAIPDEEWSGLADFIADIILEQLDRAAATPMNDTRQGEQNRAETAEHSLAIADSAVERFLDNDHDLSINPDDEIYPDEWHETPVARIRWYQEDDDASVGMQGWSGFVLAPDQTGTVLADRLEKHRQTVSADTETTAPMRALLRERIHEDAGRGESAVAHDDLLRLIRDSELAARSNQSMPDSLGLTLLSIAQEMRHAEAEDAPDGWSMSPFADRLESAVKNNADECMWQWVPVTPTGEMLFRADVSTAQWHCLLAAAPKPGDAET